MDPRHDDSLYVGIAFNGEITLENINALEVETKRTVVTQAGFEHSATFPYENTRLEFEKGQILNASVTVNIAAPEDPFELLSTPPVLSTRSIAWQQE